MSAFSLVTHQDGTGSDVSNEYMKDIMYMYKMQINGEMNKMILTVGKQLKQLHFLA